MELRGGKTRRALQWPAYGRSAPGRRRHRGWYTILPFFAAVLLVVVFAVLESRPVRARPVDLVIAAGALLGWALVALAAVNSRGHSPSTGYVLWLTVVAACIVGGAALLVS